jgi:hypothetical protein
MNTAFLAARGRSGWSRAANYKWKTAVERDVIEEWSHGLTHTTNPTIIVGIAFVVASFSLVHLARRWRLMRAKGIVSDEVSFTRAQRILHWTIGLGCAALLFTGLPVYLAQFLVNPPVPTPLSFFYWDVRVAVWRTYHIYLALMVVSLVLVHALWDVYRIRGSEKIMRLTKADFTGAWTKSRNFLGLSKEEPSQPMTKYDFFHKAFHWALIALGAFLLISGLV